MADLEYDGLKLSLHQGSLEYLSGINPQKEWNERGIKATGFSLDESKDVQNEIHDDLQRFFRREGDSEKVSRFIQESLDVYEAIYDRKFDEIQDRFTTDTIYFVTGAPRTGGTYLLKELMKIREDDLDNFNHKLMSDPLPKEHILDEERMNEPQLVFEWAQWIVWATRELNDGQFIPKKNIGIGLHPHLVDLIFGEMAEYIVTIRSPGESYQSFEERFLPEDGGGYSFDPWRLCVLQRCSIEEEHWDRLNPPDRYLLYWCSIYLEILNCDFDGRIRGLSFGQYYEQFVREIANEYEARAEPENFEPTPRDQLPEFSPECAKIKRQVEVMWEDRFELEPY